jgi:hypothetical protein
MNIASYLFSLPPRERLYAQAYAAWSRGLRYHKPADGKLADADRATIEARVTALLEAA